MDKLVPRLIGAALATAAASVALVSGAAAPAGRYVVSNGTVYDTKTKLTWQQAVAPSTYGATDAVTYCSSLSLNGTGWRLPTYKELVTILDYSVAAPGPMIDATAFPGTPGNYFNSSTPSAGMAGNVWEVQFGSGWTDPRGGGPENNVRCVR
jgi:Protein of unknown function (DUF1566)